MVTVSARHKAKLIYISTDYVFDGKSPPYAETAQTNPLNEYGRQKLAGEKVTLEKCPGKFLSYAIGQGSANQKPRVGRDRSKGSFTLTVPGALEDAFLKPWADVAVVIPSALAHACYAATC